MVNVQNKQPADSTPTHERLCQSDDVHHAFQSLQSPSLNKECVVDMRRGGVTEQALMTALEVIRANDMSWYNRVQPIVSEAINSA
jgi:hypothetical protein